MNISGTVNLKILSSFDLKIIAMITMVVDHIGIIFFPENIFLRIIGRISFVLYAFMISEGISYTRDINKYLLKLGLWAVISEIPYDLAIYNKLIDLQHQNVFFTLFIAVYGINEISKYRNYFFKILIGIFCCLLAYQFNSDYSWYGILLIFLFHFLRKEKKLKIVYINILNFCGTIVMPIQFLGCLALIPIAMYNGERGQKTGNIYYAFYAVHLIILYIIHKLTF